MHGFFLEHRIDSFFFDTQIKMTAPSFTYSSCPQNILPVLQHFLPPCILVEQLLEFGFFAGGAVAYALQYADFHPPIQFSPQKTGLTHIPPDLHDLIFAYCMDNTHGSTQQQFTSCHCRRWDCSFCSDPKVFRAECNDVDLFLTPSNAKRALDYVVSSFKRKFTDVSSRLTLRIKDTSLSEVENSDISGIPNKDSTVVSVLTLCFTFPLIEKNKHHASFPYHYKPLQLVCLKDDVKENSPEFILSRFDFDFVQCAITRRNLATRKRKYHSIILVQSQWNLSALSTRIIRFLRDDYFGVTRVRHRVRKALRKGFTFPPNDCESLQGNVMNYYFECSGCRIQDAYAWDRKNLKEFTIPCLIHPFYSNDEQSLGERLGEWIAFETWDTLEFQPLLDVLFYGEKQRCMHPMESLKQEITYTDLQLPKKISRV